MRVRGASDPGWSYRCLATFQPCNWLGDQAGFPIRAGRPRTVGPRPQGGVRCCLGKPFAPVTIVAPDAGRIWPPWSSSRDGNCCRIPRWDTRFPSSRSQAWPVRSPRGEAPIRSRWSSRTRARVRSSNRPRWCPPRRLPSAPMVHSFPRTTCRAQPMRRPARSASTWHPGPARSLEPSRSGQPRHRH